MAVTKKIDKPITGSLAAASATLLAANQAEAVSVDLYNDWTVDLAYYHYEEKDYISVDSWIGKISGQLGEENTIDLGLTLDTLSGVTHTGGLTDTSSSTSFSGVSGGGVSSDSGSGGNFATFDDRRLAVDLTWGHDFTRKFRSKAGGYVSVESDYSSIGGSLGLEFDDDSKNNTFSISIGGAMDEVDGPGKQTPEPLSVVGDGSFYSSAEKNSVEGLLGWTRVVNRNTVAMFNLSYSQSLGYHNDPYKITSIADAEGNFHVDGAIYENRPDERNRTVFYTDWVHKTKNDNFIGWNYRYYSDDWDIESHTVNLRYGLSVGSGHIIQPFVRFYTQSEAEFHQDRVLVDGDGNYELPEFVSSDVRLSKLMTYTLGTKLTLKTKKYGDFKVRGGFYKQEYEDAALEENEAVFVTFDITTKFE